MKGNMQADIMQRRLATALFVVTLLVAVAPISGAFVGDSHADEVEARPFAGIEAQALSHAGDAEGVVARLENMAGAGGETVAPVWFRREVAYLPNARDVRADGSSVVGYLVEGACDDVLDDLIAHMEVRGWTAVPLGEACGATFVKRSGTCTWALATCTQVGAATSIVFRCNAV